MIVIDDKKKCSGCTACKNICPKNAIEMVEDKEGFLYPKIDEKKCINCGLCERICPVLTKKVKKMDEFPPAFIGYDKNVLNRINSASGGAFYNIAYNFINKKNGVVVGAAFDDNFKVHHILVDDVSKLSLLQKSKYVQSNLENIFKEVENKLSNNIPVLFSGTPCQVAGIKRYLKPKLHENLYCIDLACHGVPSPKVFKKYLKYQVDKNGNIEKIIIRDKKVCKKSYRTGYGILFKNGYKYFSSHSEDPMARLFFKNICLRPICYDCAFKTIGRVSDLTLGDCYFSNYFIENFNDKYGVTLILEQSKKGAELLSNATNLVLHKIKSDEAIKINGGMLFSSARKPELRDDFFKDLNSNINFDTLANTYAPIKKEKIFNKIKYKIVNAGLIPNSLIYKKKMKEVNIRLSKKIPKESQQKFY